MDSVSSSNALTQAPGLVFSSRTRSPVETNMRARSEEIGTQSPKSSVLKRSWSQSACGFPYLKPYEKSPESSLETLRPQEHSILAVAFKRLRTEQNEAQRDPEMKETSLQDGACYPTKPVSKPGGQVQDHQEESPLDGHDSDKEDNTVNSEEIEAYALWCHGTDPSIDVPDKNEGKSPSNVGRALRDINSEIWNLGPQMATAPAVRCGEVDSALLASLQGSVEGVDGFVRRLRDRILKLSDVLLKKKLTAEDREFYSKEADKLHERLLEQTRSLIDFHRLEAWYVAYGRDRRSD